MKTLVFKLMFIALMQGISFNLFAHVILDYPVGGETFTWGQTVTIQWHVYIPHNTLNWDLYFSGDGGTTWSAIQLDLPVGQLSYQWIVPDTSVTEGRIRVVQDNDLQDYWDASMNFTAEPITLPPMLDLAAMDTVIESDLNNQEMAIQAWLNNHGGAAVTNYCANLNWTNDFIGLSNDCGISGSDIVTFTAADDCGSTVTSAILSIVDSQPPIIYVPASNLVVECDGLGNVVAFNNWLNNHGGALASDAGGNVNWTNNYSILNNSCGVTGNATVIFTATDECGNSKSAVATFTIEDNTAPAINLAANNITVECGASDQEMIIQNWLLNHAGANATDICGNVNWTNNYSTLTINCDTMDSATVIFTVSDECGNSVTTSATINFEDIIPLNIDVVARDTVLECGSPNQDSILQNWLNNEGGAVASDACGNVTWINNYTGLNAGCGISEYATVIFTANDECGNSSSTSATFSIEDHIAPNIDIVARDTSIDCEIPDHEIILQNWLNNHGEAHAQDICSGVIWSNDFIPGADSCNSTHSIKITFIAMDECGNSSSTNAILTIVRNTTTSVANLRDIDFNIYPNPVSDVLKIEFGKNEILPLQIALMDVYGKTVWSTRNLKSEMSIPVDHYASGIYFLKMETGQGFYSRKVIIE